MELHFLSVPYDTARRGERMGAGPEHLLRSGLADHLRARGYPTHVEPLDPPADAFAAEISTAFALQGAVADGVRRATARGRLPVVLSGNCNAAAVGTVAGLGGRDVGILWFDSHGDFNTPETTIGGFLDGMALAIVTGRCWRQLAARVPGFAPVHESNVVLLGTRDLDPLEAAALSESAVTVLRPGDLRDRLEATLSDLRRRVGTLYIHVDLDVLDPTTAGRANALAAPDGLAVEDVVFVLERAARHFRIGGAALTAYDPGFDADGRVCCAAFTLLESLADATEKKGISPNTKEAG